MITITYCKEGHPISDFECVEWLDSIKKSPHQSIAAKISTSLLVSYIRLAIVRRELDYNNVTFIYDGQSFQANKYGAIPNWPRGFCDKEIDLSIDILREAINMRKEERSCKEI